VLAIVALATQTIQGVDANQDEQIGPVPGEGGVLTAYQHAQLMAAVPLAPSADAPAPAPAPVVRSMVTRPPSRRRVFRSLRSRATPGCHQRAGRDRRR